MQLIGLHAFCVYGVLVTTISTARRKFSFLWLEWIELLYSMGTDGEARSGGAFVASGMGHALRSSQPDPQQRESTIPLGWLGVGLLD